MGSQRKDSKHRSEPNSVRSYILSQIAAHPTDIVGVTARVFKVSAVAVQKHLRRLIAEGLVEKQGRTRDVRWLLVPRGQSQKILTISSQITEDAVFREEVAPKVGPEVKPNVREIIQYGFTEMFNNIIDHSGATKVDLKINSDDEMFSIELHDNGLGIFKKIQDAFGLADPRDSILQLTKGKVTTDPVRHSGEGIFFTSRAFEHFSLVSGGIAFVKDNRQDDWLIAADSQHSGEGTSVRLEIRKNASKRLHDIFAQYTNPDSYRFDRTHIIVELARNTETEFISRSQAKRILVGLEKFRRVVLDFRNVNAVGQAFVDEVFRVFANAHPEVKFEVVNANDNIQFMIRRGISTETHQS